MKNRQLKIFRVYFSLLLFLAATLVFIDITYTWAPGAARGVLFLQFVPSLLYFLSFAGWLGTGFLLVMLLTALFGRVYCSVFCPLGTLQDLIGYLHRKLVRKKHRYVYRKPRKILWYSLLGLTALLLATGFVQGVLLLDPFSNFGRIATCLLKPATVWVNNVISAGVSRLQIYYVYPVPFKGIGIAGVVAGAAWLIGLILFVVFGGRQYCNTLCPVGALLGLVSKISLFRIRIKKSVCNSCGSCGRECKAGCIDTKAKTVDFSRCVGCFNCLTVCPQDGIAYRFALQKQTRQTHEEGTDLSKRKFLFTSALYGLGFLALTKRVFAQDKVPWTGFLPVRRKVPVAPPGAMSFDRLAGKCTGCHLCITVCPSQVIQPSLKEYGWEHVLQPVMDYKLSFCSYECNKCTQVCPSGALVPLTVEEKKRVQMGVSHFVKENCVVFINGTACAACSENCPTKAVHMVPFRKGLKIPKVDPEICTGCGGCEYACPTKPHKAIYVEGHSLHKTARKPLPKNKTIREETVEEFPF